VVFICAGIYARRACVEEMKKIHGFVLCDITYVKNGRMLARKARKKILLARKKFMMQHQWGCSVQKMPCGTWKSNVEFRQWRFCNNVRQKLQDTEHEQRQQSQR
jgi:hypothetical protein